MRVLGIVLVALVCVLSFGGAALAHAPVHHEQRAVHAYSDRSVHREDSRSLHAGEWRDPTGAASSYTAFASPRGFGSLKDMAADVDLSDDCCGVACHAAIGGRTWDNRTWHLPMSAVIAAAPSLRGNCQGRLERPPRVF